MSVFLIDGYNVLHQFLGQRAVDDLEEERGRLLDRIASYMGGSSDRAIVVFDSRVQMLQKIESATANVEVYFGSFSRSADSIIEREVYALSRKESVVVVSSDYQLQKTTFLPNVIRRSSRQFVNDLQEHTKKIAISPNCITMSQRVEDRIDSTTADRLRALRDSLAARPEEREDRDAEFGAGQETGRKGGTRTG
ncbi:MAG: NYN domain-containing protein [Thermoleophilia bacterium]|nr:NYN domain-containing protein [Thermoleophilia bacterium]